MFSESSRRFVADSRKIIDTGVRCFADAAPAAMTGVKSAEQIRGPR